jgi:hypothetical protein
MTTDELRNAAERILAAISLTQDETGLTYEKIPEGRVRLSDAYELAVAWLAANPAPKFPRCPSCGGLTGHARDCPEGTR